MKTSWKTQWMLGTALIASPVLATGTSGGTAPTKGTRLVHAAPPPPKVKTTWKFDFGAGNVQPGTLPVLPTTTYTAERGYGFEPGGAITACTRSGPDELRSGSCTNDKPFLFSVALPEGNYRVTVTLGDQTTASNTTVKAETRRLMLENVPTTPGQFATRTFTVNVRTPHIATGGAVHLNARETGPPLVPHWDDKLTLEFNGTRPCLCGLEITAVENATTVFLAGDSTVTDQRSEPWAGWGQMLPRFFTPDVAIANHAESGLALGSFKAQKRLDKVLGALKPGDYVFLQFGHNDQKDKAPGAGPFTTYKAHLKDFLREIKGKGGLPVLVTPMERRRWSPQGKPQSTLAEYAEAVRQVGKEESAPIIDLNALSLTFYQALGPENSKKAFVHYAAGTFPGQTEALKDDTHFNNYGGYELARCLVEGIKSQVPALAKHLARDVKPYNPTQPDPVESFALPASPFTPSEKPAGS